MRDVGVDYVAGLLAELIQVDVEGTGSRP